MTNIYFQLFTRMPDLEFINKIVQLYGIKDLDINYKFTLRDLQKMGTVEKLNEMRGELKNIYLNCKFCRYVDNLTEKKSITILRHFLKVINYKLVSQEKYSDSRKYLVYRIKCIDVTQDNYDFTINFD